jgi:hypothetical protein
VVSGEEVGTEQRQAARPDLELELASANGERHSRFAHHPELPAGFDAAFYLAAHPDLVAACADPYQHYVTYGRTEGRRYKAG